MRTISLSDIRMSTDVVIYLFRNNAENVFVLLLNILLALLALIPKVPHLNLKLLLIKNRRSKNQRQLSKMRVRVLERIKVARRKP